MPGVVFGTVPLRKRTSFKMLDVVTPGIVMVNVAEQIILGLSPIIEAFAWL